MVQAPGHREDHHRFHHLWEGVARRELEEVDLSEQFLIETLTARMPAYARIFATEVCARCGEGVMEPRIRVQGGQKVCLACAGEEYYSPHRPGDRLQPGDLRRGRRHGLFTGPRALPQRTEFVLPGMDGDCIWWGLVPAGAGWQGEMEVELWSGIRQDDRQAAGILVVSC